MHDWEKLVILLDAQLQEPVKKGGIKFKSWNSKIYFHYHCSFISYNKIELILMPTIKNFVFKWHAFFQ